MKSYLLLCTLSTILLIGCAPPKETIGKANPDGSEAVVAEVAKISPDEKYETITKEFEDKNTEFMAAYRASKTDKERQSAFEKMPEPENYASQLMDMATANPDTEAAVDALVWVAMQVQGVQSETATDLLMEKYEANPKTMPVVFSMAFRSGPEVEQKLRGLTESSESDSVRGVAAYSLAAFLMNSGRSVEATEEAAALMKQVVDEHADLQISIGDKEIEIAPMAASALFALNHLQVGKVAPEIEGTDLDGVKFKLSEYRGKVVLLDFWGHW